MEFNEEQIDAIEKLVDQEISNKMLMEQFKSLKSAIDEIVEKDGWRLKSKVKTMIENNDAFIVEQPMPEPDANHVDDPEQLM